MLTGVSSCAVVTEMALERYTHWLMDASPEFPIHFLKIYSLDRPRPPARDHRAPPAPARPLRHRPGRGAAWRRPRRLSGPGSLPRAGGRCAGAVARRHHSVPLGALCGRCHGTRLSTDVVQRTDECSTVSLSTTPSLMRAKVSALTARQAAPMVVSVHRALSCARRGCYERVRRLDAARTRDRWRVCPAPLCT